MSNAVTGLSSALGVCVSTSVSAPRVTASLARAGSPRCRHALVVDPDAGWREWLSTGFRSLGVELATAASVAEAHKLCTSTSRFDLVTIELSFADGTWFDVLRSVRTTGAASLVVVVTALGSIASAVEALHSGVDNYLVKPATAESILAALKARTETPAVAPSHMSLDRAIWEYLTQTVASTGSIAGAARSLRLDRRSLRRMLSKNPPLR